MNLNLTLATPAEGEKPINCNCEASFDEKKLGPLWTAMNLLVQTGEQQQLSESAYLQNWLRERNLTPEQVEALPKLAPKLAEAVIDRDFEESIIRLRTLCTDRSERATLYKILFITSMVSTRHVSKLAARIKRVREAYEINERLAMQISDAIGRTMPDYPYRPQAVDPADAEIILALVFESLSADSQKHVNEIAVCKDIIQALGITKFNSAHLTELTHKGLKDLVATLSEKALPAAFVNILRIILADGAVKPEETVFARAIGARLAGNVSLALLKFAALEYGRVFELK